MARRVLLLFIVGAGAPVAVMAFLSYVAITDQLRAQRERELDELVSIAAQSILERLSNSAVTLRGAAALASRIRLPAAAPGEWAIPLPPTTLGLVLELDGWRVPVAGAAGEVPELSASDRAHLAEGGVILLTHAPDPEQGLRLWMGVPLEAESGATGTLWGRMIADSLWSSAVTRTSAARIDEMCVLDSMGTAMFCLTGPDSPLPRRVPSAQLRSASSGQVELASQQGKDLVSWRDVYLRASFNAPPFTVVVSQPTAALYDASDGFVYNLLLTLLIGVSAALLVTHVLVRRTMEPLEALAAGTRTIAGHDLSARVTVRSRDEFGDLAASFNAMAEGLDLQFKHLEARRSIDHAALTAGDQADAIRALLVAVGEIVPSSRRGLLLRQQEPEGSATLFKLDGAGQALQRTALPRAAGAIGLLTQAASAQHEQPAKVRALFEPLLANASGPMLLLPLRARGIPIGAIALLRDSGRPFSEDEVQRGQALADHAAVALEKLRLDEDLSSMSFEVLRAFANAIDAKSAWTTGHSERVTALSLVMGRAMGLEDVEIETLHRGGLLHDIGKIGVPAAVLDHDGALDHEMRRLLQKHPAAGARILEPIRAFKPILPIVRYHHEWWDGGGYPDGLCGEAIPPLARLVAVADVFDAMISARPYRPALDPTAVLDHIRAGAESQFDPQMVGLLETVWARGWRPQERLSTAMASSQQRTRA